MPGTIPKLATHGRVTMSQEKHHEQTRKTTLMAGLQGATPGIKQENDSGNAL